LGWGYSRREKQKESTSFLKKRSKKLLLIASNRANTVPLAIDKSFLVLFFKKELLAFPSS